MMLLIHGLVSSLFITLCVCTTDINIHQLQMVADHLSQIECRKLTEALHEKKTFLTKRLSGEREPEKPCIVLLLRWDRTEGKGKTFNDLALRLGQIGRRDLANKLSKTIYHEESEELKRIFLDQPFQKKIPKHSFLLAQDEDDKPNEELAEADDMPAEGLSALEITGVVVGIVSAFLILGFLVYVLFGSVIAKWFKKYAPDFMVSWVELVGTQISWLWRNFKRDYSVNVVGSKAGRDMSRQSRQWTVEEMNRNLNNYLNGHIPEEVRNYYFRKLATSK